MACSHSSLLNFMNATLIRHGQAPDRSEQVGHATRRGTGVRVKMAVPKALWSAAAKLPLSALGVCGPWARGKAAASRPHSKALAHCSRRFPCGFASPAGI